MGRRLHSRPKYLARTWKNDSEILLWLKQLATSKENGLCAGPPFGKARKFASLGRLPPSIVAIS
jgi:hypothetical protein